MTYYKLSKEFEELGYWLNYQGSTYQVKGFGSGVQYTEVSREGIEALLDKIKRDKEYYDSL